MQKLMITGNLGGDPEMRYTGSGTPVVNFSVAVSKRWTSASGERQEKTTWFKVAVWDKLADPCHKYLKKGSKVLVVGEVEASPYIDKEGNPRASLEVTAREVEFLDRKESGNGHSEEEVAVF